MHIRIEFTELKRFTGRSGPRGLTVSEEFVQSAVLLNFRDASSPCLFTEQKRVSLVHA